MEHGVEDFLKVRTTVWKHGVEGWCGEFLKSEDQRCGKHGVENTVWKHGVETLTLSLEGVSNRSTMLFSQSDVVRE